MPTSSRYALRIVVSIAIAASVVSFPPIKPTVDLPLSDAQAKDFLEAEGILDQIDSVPGDKEIEFALPTQKQTAKLFGFPVGFTETEEIEIYLVDKGTGVGVRVESIPDATPTA